MEHGDEILLDLWYRRIAYRGGMMFEGRLPSANVDKQRYFAMRARAYRPVVLP